MATKPKLVFTTHFATLPDPRQGNATRHLLGDIVAIAICGVICGADSWAEIEVWGCAKQDWLKTFLELPHGIPSHDTFGRVFAQLDPEAFQACFVSWIRAISKLTQGEVIAIDGKKLRRSHDHRLGKQAIWMVSAWATVNHLVLGQRKVRSKSNEIKAIPELLAVLELADTLVTIDAMGCQKKIAAKIVEKKGDYLLAVKKNQGHLYQDLKDLFSGCEEVKFQQVSHEYAREVNKGHGRIEIRQCWLLAAPEYLGFLRRGATWKNLRAVVKVLAEHKLNGKWSRQIRYYITSVANDAQRILQATRAHWGIENGLHWVLDIAFREDESRVRQAYAPQNFALLRHIALNLLKQETTARVGIKGKRLKAASDNAYLLNVLALA
jgi:predicted transposase YbfD/YdcC